ncbi:MAG: NAD-dependent epimerase/dehydratase family protein [Chloroflexota bacterium]
MKALITGATGFLGQHLALHLAARGWEITGTGRDMTKGRRLIDQGIRFLPVDLTDWAGIFQLCQDQEVVFHCGGLSSVWGNKIEFERANVDGTQNIIDACLEQRVGRLVHISTPSLYFNGDSRLQVKEDDPLPAAPINHYVWSKLEAEKRVDRAVAHGLAAITLRPRAIYGPGDQSLVPRVVRTLKTGRLRIIGEGDNVQNMTHVSNLVAAICLAADAPQHLSGRKFNITDGEEVKIWEVIQGIAERLNFPPITKKISHRAAHALATGLEWGHRLLPLSGEPLLTRYTVSVLSQSQTLDISAAERDLGYRPLIGSNAGIEATLEELAAG